MKETIFKYKTCLKNRPTRLSCPLDRTIRVFGKPHPEVNRLFSILIDSPFSSWNNVVSEELMEYQTYLETPPTITIMAKAILKSVMLIGPELIKDSDDITSMYCYDNLFCLNLKNTRSGKSRSMRILKEGNRYEINSDLKDNDLVLWNARLKEAGFSRQDITRFLGCPEEKRRELVARAAYQL